MANVSKPESIKSSISSLNAEQAQIGADIGSLESQKSSVDTAKKGLIDSKLRKLKHRDSQVKDQVSFLQFEANQTVATKPIEKSLGFMQNFAEHQQNFFEDSAYKFSEFASTSGKAKEAYKLVRKADQFWQGEQEFLGQLKNAGKSRDNNAELQAALRDLFTLELQMGSRFDADFANIEAGKKGDSERSGLDSAISEKKSEIRTLHSNLA